MKTRISTYMKFFLVFIITIFLFSYFGSAYSVNQTVMIPFGAYDPTFETPADNWYEPPVVFIQNGDTITWINNDREGHTVTSGTGAGTSGIESEARNSPSDLSVRSIKFTAMVYDNPKKIFHEEILVQPAKRVELQYEILVAIIVVPGSLAVVAVLYMMYRKPKSTKTSNEKSAV